jgi:2-polyprenyl-3-methyl-5-hydroxy-6-metoxy-1,4-benzoquinol methylase
MFPTNDPDIVRQIFASKENLLIRQDIHDKYTVPKLDYVTWALSCVQWRGDEQVLDVGCGPGRWATVMQEQLPDVTYYGLDLHAGMVANHPVTRTLGVGDIQQLPYPDNTFDVVMANHMLFHVPDIEQAIRECRRVLKPEGIMLAATNSVNNMPEFQVLFRRAITLLAPPGTSHIQIPLPSSHLFTLESGTRFMSRQFFAVVRYDLPSALVFPEVEPVMSYLESTRQMREPQLPEGIWWDDVMVIVREQITRLLEHFGEVAINKLAGVLIGTDKGDFIREYLVYREKTLPNGASS